MATPVEGRLVRLLVQQWDAVKGQLYLLSLPDARPDDGHLIFSIIRQRRVANEIGVEIGPIVFNLPERANGNADLFVVVEGRMYFDERSINENSLLRTTDFGTHVAYFRKKDDQLIHVYGAHYEFSMNQAGHPAFHAQMRSFIDLHNQVAKEYEMTDCSSKDLVDGVLRNVRLPSAQMDFFSFALQLCADHLIHQHSGTAERVVFEDLIRVNEEIKGSAFLIARFSKPAVQDCLRAHHWYP